MLREYLDKCKGKIKSSIKDSRFWLTQIVDIVIVLLLFLWFTGKIPLTYVLIAVGVFVTLQIYMTLKKAYKTAKKQTEKGEGINEEKRK